MSRVQVAALEILIILEQIAKARAEQQQLKLALMGRDPDLVRLWFPEWFPEQQVSIRSSEEVEQVVEHDLAGGSSVWEAGETPPISPEEMEAMIASLSSGRGSLASQDTDWE